MRFANPEAFFLLIPLVAAMWYYFKIAVRHRSRIVMSQTQWTKQRPRDAVPTPFRMMGFVRPLILVLMIVGIARPQRIFEIERRTVESIDMIICFDLSKSMEALDFQPNRRTVALNTISSFIDSRPDDRIGLVIFSGEAYLAVPPTLDHQFLKTALHNSSDQDLQDGTAIGQAIATTVSNLKDSQSKSRLIILVTDGDNNMGSVDPITAAEMAKGYGLKVHTVGIGSRGVVHYPIRQRDVFGREVEVLRQLTDAVDEELLKNIAQMTGGLSFHAAEQDVLQQIFESIDSLERTKVESTTLLRTTEIAWPWIRWALLLLILEILAFNTVWRKIP